MIIQRRASVVPLSLRAAHAEFFAHGLRKLSGLRVPHRNLRTFPTWISSAPSWWMHDSAPTASPQPSPTPRVRRDGWTIDRQVKFICALRSTGSVTRAAAAAGMSRESAYRFRERPGHEDFARAWDCAVAAKGHNLPRERRTPSGIRASPPPREGHESHAGRGFPRHCQPSQLRSAVSAPSSGPASAAAGPWIRR
jgi:hypothetical protein